MATQKFLQAFSSLSILLSLLFCFETSLASPYCTPSMCGIIRNISSPFRLKADPKHCGDPRAELACENNVTVFYLDTHKYYVKAINNSTIRLTDASINNNTCSFPNDSLNTELIQHDDFFLGDPWPINLMSCPYPLKNSAFFTQNFTHCATSYSNSSNPRYSYIKVGRINASDVPEMCRVDVIVRTSWEFKDSNNAALSEIHHSLLYGFELEYFSPILDSVGAIYDLLEHVC